MKNINIYKKSLKLPLLYLLFIVVSILCSLLLLLFGIDGAEAALFAVLVEPAVFVFHKCMELGYCHVGGAKSWWEFGPVIYAISIQFLIAVLLYVVNFIYLKVKKEA